MKRKCTWVLLFGDVPPEFPFIAKHFFSCLNLIWSQFTLQWCVGLRYWQCGLEPQFVSSCGFLLCDDRKCYSSCRQAFSCYRAPNRSFKSDKRSATIGMGLTPFQSAQFECYSNACLSWAIIIADSSGLRLCVRTLSWQYISYFGGI